MKLNKATIKEKILEKLQEKLKETLDAVIPILVIVLILCFSIAPIESGILLAFLLGAVLLIIGMVLFTFGVDLAMIPIGENVGTCMTQTKKLWLIALLSFILGFIVTISEPDLQVLAEQVPSIPNMVLVLAVAIGVGIFLVAAALRMLFGITLAHMLIVLYGIIFILTYFVPGDFIAIAFDSGGVTTGPMTVPFIMALGLGISAIRSDERAEDDSFGLVALSSVGPILSVLILSLIYHPETTEYAAEPLPEIHNSVELWSLFAEGFPEYMKEMAVSLLPIIVFFIIFQIIFKKMKKKMIVKIIVGMVYTYIGLVLSLTGANAGRIGKPYVEKDILDCRLQDSKQNQPSCHIFFRNTVFRLFQRSKCQNHKSRHYKPDSCKQKLTSKIICCNFKQLISDFNTGISTSP